MAGSACDENRCEYSPRSIYDDTKPIGLCTGDTARFVPSAVTFLVSPPDGEPAGDARPVGATVRERTTVVQLVVEGTDGFRRDHAHLDLYVCSPEDSAGTAGSLGFAGLGGENGDPAERAEIVLRAMPEFPQCSVIGTALVCTTGPDGKASFGVERLSRTPGTAWICVDAPEGWGQPIEVQVQYIDRPIESMGGQGGTP